MLAIHGSNSGLSILPSGSIEFYSPLTNLFPGNQARKSMLRDIIMDEIRPKRMYFNEIREWYIVSLTNKGYEEDKD